MTTNVEIAVPSVNPWAAIVLIVRKAKPTMNSAATSRISRRARIAADYPRVGYLTPASVSPASGHVPASGPTPSSACGTC
jgi:hypothetical protein